MTGTGSSSAGPLLTQPRQLAVLAYLVLARPRGLHSRDTLVGMLWPESDQAGGRHALRNVLHAIRRALGAGVIVTAGDGMVGVDSDQIACDAIELERDLAAKSVDEPLAKYHGELLQGFFVSDAPEFERWLDGERRRLRESLLTAAWSLADEKRNAGDVEGALRTARAALALAPEDEISLRRFLRLLEAAGDRFGAVRAYDEFAARLKREYDAEPSVETRGIAHALREKAAATQGVSPASAPREVTGLPLVVTNSRVIVPADSPVAVAVPPAYHAARTRGAKWRWALAAGIVITVVGAAAVLRADREPSRTGAPKKLLVLPMENETGDSRLDYVGTGLADGIATRLEGIGGITVRSGARSDWPAATRHDFKEIGRMFGSVILLKTVLGTVNDSLEVRASVLDLASSVEKPIVSRRFTMNELRNMESDLAASVAGAVFRVPLPDVSRAATRPVDPESYRLTLLGVHQLKTHSDLGAARESFLAATRIDPLNARAWSGLSSALSSGGDASVLGDELDEMESAAARALAIDSLQGTALVSIGLARAFRYRNLADGLEWTRKAIAVDPSNPEVFLVLAVLYRHAWMWNNAIDAFRIAERLDPLTLLYAQREADVELCADRPARALPLFQRILVMSSSDSAGRSGFVRTLVQLGRYDDAISEWRTASRISGDTALVARLSRAQGQSGYWTVKHEIGRRRLANLQQRARGEKVSPVKIMQAQFEAGDGDAGFADIAALIPQRSAALYRLPCMPQLDEVRGTDRYKEMLKRTGHLPLR